MKTDDDNPFSEIVEVEITDVFDLHSYAPKEVKIAVKEYLKEARKKKFSIVRIIHGKGIGVQREIVRHILSETDFVKKFSDAGLESGSWGATIVHFK